MLHLETVYPETLKLLRKLQDLKSLAEFSLAGGTALSLYFGHRISIDLDFFTHKHFNTEDVILELNDSFSSDNLSILNVDQNCIFLSINDVKIDILAHRYPMLVSNVSLQEELRLYAIEDIIAMKLNALANRGTKKDFFDIFETLQHFSLDDILSFFEKKYTNNDRYYILRSLTFFEDAEKDLEPIMLKQYDWERVKIFISKSVSEYLS